MTLLLQCLESRSPSDADSGLWVAFKCLDITTLLLQGLVLFMLTLGLEWHLNV